MSIIWLPGNCPKIKKLPHEELEALVTRIRPCYLDKKERLVFMEVPCLTSTAFTWSPKKLRLATEWGEVGRIETYHTCGGYIGFFKPTIAEVLAQIPQHLLNEVNAFVTLTGDTVACYSEADGHRTVTILYDAEMRT